MEGLRKDKPRSLIRKKSGFGMTGQGRKDDSGPLLVIPRSAKRRGIWIWFLMNPDLAPQRTQRNAREKSKIYGLGTRADS